MTIFNILLHMALYPLTQSSNSFTFFTSCPQKLECYLQLESMFYAFGYVLAAPSVVCLMQRICFSKCGTDLIPGFTTVSYFQNWNMRECSSAKGYNSPICQRSVRNSIQRELQAISKLHKNVLCMHQVKVKVA